MATSGTAAKYRLAMNPNVYFYSSDLSSTVVVHSNSSTIGGSGSIKLRMLDSAGAEIVRVIPLYTTAAAST